VPRRGTRHAGSAELSDFYELGPRFGGLACRQRWRETFYQVGAVGAGIKLLDLVPHKSFERSPRVGAHLCSRSATRPHASSATEPHPSAEAATAPPAPPVGHPLLLIVPLPRCFSLNKVSYSVPPSFVKITVIGC
jgi:hypothetical protein